MNFPINFQRMLFNDMEKKNHFLRISRDSREHIYLFMIIDL